MSRVVTASTIPTSAALGDSSRNRLQTRDPMVRKPPLGSGSIRRRIRLARRQISLARSANIRRVTKLRINQISLG
jgi:hypothetical protein